MEKDFREERLSFICYFSWAVTIFPYLSDQELGQLMRAVFSYQKTGVIPTMPPSLAMPFANIKDTLDRDHQAWLIAREKRSKAGKKGMRSRWSADDENNKNNIEKIKIKPTKKQKKLYNGVIKNYNNVMKKCNNVIKNITMLRKNITVNVNDNVNVNVNVNDNVNVNVNERMNDARNLSLKQLIFKKHFPNIIIDTDFSKKHDVMALITKIKESNFLSRPNHRYLSFYISLYDKIMADYYKNRPYLDDQNNVKSIEKEINECYDRFGTYEEKFKSLSELAKSVVGSPETLKEWGMLSEFEFKKTVPNEIKTKYLFLKGE